MNKQLSLITEPRARHDEPTSKAAAESVAPIAGFLENQIVACVGTGGPCTADWVARRLLHDHPDRWTHGTVITALSRVAAAGRNEPVGCRTHLAWKRSDYVEGDAMSGEVELIGDLLDEVYALRRALAYEASVVAAHLTLKSFPKSRRKFAMDQTMRMRQAARGQVARAYAGTSSLSLRSSFKEAGAPETLTRNNWRGLDAAS